MIDNRLMPRLEIILVSDSHVAIERNVSVNDTLWSRFCFYWLDSVLAKRPIRIEITIEEFESRMAWVVSTRRRGIEIWIDPQVEQRLREVNHAFRQFEELATNAQFLDLPIADLSDVIRPLTLDQVNNVNSMLRIKSGANFSVPGAGKTATEVLIFSQLHRGGEVGKMLVVAPISAFNAWESEPKLVLQLPPVVEEFNGTRISLNSDIVIVNYEQLENHHRCDYLASWLRQNRGMLVLDEAHRVKGGSRSVRWRACRQLSEQAVRTDLLTGTPMPQSSDDLRNLFELSWGPKARQFLTPTMIGRLQRGGIFVRTTKDELGLPPISTETVQIEMKDYQRQIYGALCNAYLGQFKLNARDANMFGRRGRAALTLIGAAANPGLLLRGIREDAYLGLQWPPREVSTDATLLGIVEEYASCEIPAKYEWISRMVNLYAERRQKVLIWSTFVGNLLALKRLLSKFNPAIVHGSISTDERKSEIDRFRNSSDCAVLLTNPQTLGEGISLHDCCHMAIYLDRSYNAGLYLQSIDRIHRLGLPPDTETKIYLLEAEGSIDTRVSARLTTKIRNLANVMNDPGLGANATPLDFDDLEVSDLLALFSQEDLFEHLTTNAD